MKKILTGIKPTGSGMHIGNYFGAVLPLIELSKKYDTTLFIPDYHSLTSVHDGDILTQNKARMLREYISLLPKNVRIFEQSKIDHINNMAWVLSSVTPYSLMLRAHSFKDAQNKNSDINMAIFNYPILMAADIISYDFDIVPVGKDQKQHLEFARDIAGNFNRTYGVDFFKLPEPHIDETVMTIPGTDGRKMSKSYNNHIGIFDDEKTLKKKIMSIVTGSEGLDDPKDPENCNVFALIKLFASEEKQTEIAQKYREGGYGYGHAKLELLDLILQYFSEARAKYQALEKDDNELQHRLEKGNHEANEMATQKYTQLMHIVGLGK
ncbi:tryptophan--tRNA ligase [Candidatus Gracilibacteria bacterium]|nr:tryptophan--tRNA ligase [Candidatus Gracilibacteria bacterium]